MLALRHLRSHQEVCYRLSCFWKLLGLYLELGNCRFGHLCRVLEAGLGSFLAPAEDVGACVRPWRVVVPGSSLAIKLFLHLLQLPKFYLYLLLFHTVIFHLQANRLLVHPRRLQLHHLSNHLLLNCFHRRILLKGNRLDLLDHFLRFIKVVIFLNDLKFIEHCRAADLLPHLLWQRLLLLLIRDFFFGGSEQLLFDWGLIESSLGNSFDRLVEVSRGVRMLRCFLTETSGTEGTLRKVF